MPSKSSESGNVLLIILIAVVLIGALTAAIQSSSQHGANIDKENLVLRISELKRYASELESGVRFILQNGKSESDIRFAAPDAPTEYGDLSADTDTTDQIFARDGGAATYRAPPPDINDESPWEFYGNTALPDVGSDAPELIAVLPHVTEDFCKTINTAIGYGTTQPEDSGACLNAGASDRFGDSNQFSSSSNTVLDNTFTQKPAIAGCVKCADNSYNYFHVLLAR